MTDTWDRHVNEAIGHLTDEEVIHEYRNSKFPLVRGIIARLEAAVAAREDAEGERSEYEQKVLDSEDEATKAREQLEEKTQNIRALWKAIQIAMDKYEKPPEE